ncbi:MAG TPA: sigma-E factor negative regulatory protein [Burkholderiaceae bacterium]
MNAIDDAVLNESLSAVMDGRATPADWARVNAAWAGDPALRERWALWHAAGDGLRSADLLTPTADPQWLLDALHARLPAAIVEYRRRRDWLAPIAVAAGFVAVAFGIGLLRPSASTEAVVAAAPFATPRAQGLSGLSFAQTAAGRTLPAVGAAREPGLPADATPEVIDWGLALPEPAASRPAR